MLSNIPCSSLTLSTVIVTPKRFERLTYCLEGSCSIQLSYGVIIFFISPMRFDRMPSRNWNCGMLYPAELRSLII